MYVRTYIKTHACLPITLDSYWMSSRQYDLEPYLHSTKQCVLTHTTFIHIHACLPTTFDSVLDELNTLSLNTLYIKHRMLTRMYVCMCVPTFVHITVHTYVHVCTCTRIQPSMHASTYRYRYAYIPLHNTCDCVYSAVHFSRTCLTGSSG